MMSLPSGLPLREAASLVGTSAGNLSSYLSGRLVPGRLVAGRLVELAALTPEGALEVRLAGTMPQLAAEVRRSLAKGAPPHRWVAQWRSRFRTLGEQSAQRLALVEPASTRHRGWDALLAGVAEQEAMSAGVQVPGWTAASGRTLDHFWLAELPEGLLAYALVHTRPALKRRGVLLPDSELESV